MGIVTGPPRSCFGATHAFRCMGEVADAALRGGILLTGAAVVIQRILGTAYICHSCVTVVFDAQPWPLLCQECATLSYSEQVTIALTGIFSDFGGRRAQT